MNKRKTETVNEEIEEFSEIEDLEATQPKKKQKSSSSSTDFLHTKQNEQLSSAESLDDLIQRILTYSRENGYRIQHSTLYEDLRNAQLTNEGKVLIITSQDEHPGEMPRFPKEIYVQSQYKDVYSMIQQRFSRPKNESPCKDFIVLGNPGIGKTIFGLYFMWKLVSSSTLFMYEARKDKIRLYLPGYAICINRDQADELCMVFRREIVYLVDLAESHDEADATIVYKYAVVFTSPNPSRYKSFAKGNEARILYMKRPTVDEVKDIWRSLCTFNQIDEKVIDKQLKRFGPIPRYVLFPDKYDKLFLQSVIQSKGEAACRTLLEREFRLEGNDEDRSHALIHLDSNDYLDFFYRSASQYVVKKLMEEQKQNLSQSLLAFMANPIPLLNGLAGDVLDILAPWGLLPGKTHSIQPLRGHRKYGDRLDAIETTEAFNLHLIKTKRLSNNWETDETFKPKQNVYYTQETRILKSIDGFAIEGDNLYLFQITVSKTHPVLGNGLERVIKVVRRKHEREEMKAFLIFVTASSNTAKRIKSIQPLLSKDGHNYSSVEAIPKKIRALASEQYVLHLSE